VIGEFRKPGLTPADLTNPQTAEVVLGTLRDMKAAGWTAHTIQTAITEATGGIS